MFRRGLYCGMFLGSALSFGFVSLIAYLLVMIGGENLAELGVKLHAAERNYLVRAEPRGSFTEEELSEPSREEVRKMIESRKNSPKQKKILTPTEAHPGRASACRPDTMVR